MKPLSSSQRVMPSMASTLPGATDSDCRRHEVSRRHALERGIDGGEQDRGPVAALDAGEPRQRGHALRDEAGMRRHPVIGQAVPGRELQHRRCRARRTPSARASAAMRGPSRHTTTQARRRRVGARGDGAGEIGDDQPFGAVGDARQGQRAARGAGVRRGLRAMAQLAPSPRRLKVAQPPEQRRCRRSAGTAASPVTQASSSRSGTSISRSNSASSSSRQFARWRHRRSGP